jgi:hypothetical protein
MTGLFICKAFAMTQILGVGIANAVNLLDHRIFLADPAR